MLDEPTLFDAPQPDSLQGRFEAWLVANGHIYETLKRAALRLKESGRKRFGVKHLAEEVRWNTNELQYVECTGVGRQEYYFGVTTAGGYAAFGSTPGVILPTTFIDQANSVILPANMATRNRPFRSDHVLNLNL